MDKNAIEAVLQKIESTETRGDGNARVKTIVNWIVRDQFLTIEDLDIAPHEF